MKAPNELYLHPNHKGEAGGNWLTFTLTNQDIKYIRADLAELTWEDIEKLDKIMGEVWHDGNFGDLNEGFYTEVLRRFLESKRK